MVSIYALETDGLIWYIGSTTVVNNRKIAHKNRVDKGVSADLIPIEYEFEFKILEECDSENRLVRERYWYELLKPLNNKEVPGRSEKEYIQDNKEKIKENKKKYYQNNKEKKKEYYQNNKEKILKKAIEYNNLHRDHLNELRRISYAKKKASLSSPSSSQEQ